MFSRMAFKVFLVTGFFCSVCIVRCLGKFCDGDYPCSSYYQVCCNDVCTTGSTCVGHRCFTSKNCLSSESCCNSVCVKGDNCLGRKCDYDGECLKPQEKCCLNKCTNMSVGLCVDVFSFVSIIIACVWAFALSLGFILGGVLYLRRRKRNRAHLRGQVLALPTEQPYQQFYNEEPEHNEATVQETLPPLSFSS